MLYTSESIDPRVAIQSGSARIEDTFLAAGKTLESSIEILNTLTAGFEALLVSLAGDELGQALNGLSHTAARVNALAQNQSRTSATFDRMLGLAEVIGRRIGQMKTSLTYVDALAVTAKIAAANIDVPGDDFTAFADEILRTLRVTTATLESFAAELQAVRGQITSAHAGQLVFEASQHRAASSITQRLSSTVNSIALHHQRAARSGHEVKLGSARVRQRICDAIEALQIGDITRQRLEHTEAALIGMNGTAADRPPDDDDEQRSLAAAVCWLQSAQLSDTAVDFNREVRLITASLDSLAVEARALKSQGDSAFGSSDRDGGSFITDLESEVGEALTLLQGFETEQAAATSLTEGVSAATGRLCGHLRIVQSLEADIRIMSLNATFKCARIGRQAIALGFIAQELRTYANGFAKAAGQLMDEVEQVAAIAGSLGTGTGTEQMPLEVGQGQGMRESYATLRKMGTTLDTSMADLGRDSDRVVTLLAEAVANLGAHSGIGGLLSAAAENLSASSSKEQFTLACRRPSVARMLEATEQRFTMTNERAVHDRTLGRARPAEAAAATEMEDFLF